MDYKIIRAYKDDMIADLRELVAIRSVAENPCDGYPCGKEAARALELILARAREFGFETVNHGNVSGHAQYGSGDGYAAVLTHVDVVPEGEGWDSDPFTLDIRDGRMYGRGVADDKGAAIVSLYCMKALKDAGITGKRALRCIFGCGEEIGMVDMETYFASEPLPEMAFTPDSDYPVCSREKGIMRTTVSIPVGESAISVFDAGTAVNCVAEKASMVIACDEIAANEIASLAAGYGCEAIAEKCDGGYKVSAKGKSAHAMCPQEGINAACALVLAADRVLGEKDSFVASAVELLCSDYYGIGMGINGSDEPSGRLTANVGTVRIDERYARFCVDIRYPVTFDGDEIYSKIAEKAKTFGAQSVLDENLAPIYMPDDHPLIRALCDCYESVTGQPGHTYSSGGGTYARSLGGNGVAFGLAFPDSPPTNLHQANEGFDVEDYMRHAEICLAAMYRMFTM